MTVLTGLVLPGGSEHGSVPSLCPHAVFFQGLRFHVQIALFSGGWQALDLGPTLLLSGLMFVTSAKTLCPHEVTSRVLGAGTQTSVSREGTPPPATLRVFRTRGVPVGAARSTVVLFAVGAGGA